MVFRAVILSFSGFIVQMPSAHKRGRPYLSLNLRFSAVSA
nr:MAG TPA: hypothetical protein [Caudoviricetes sp.]